MDLLRILAVIPQISADSKALGSALNAAISDPGVAAEVKAHPGVAAIVARISAEWRTVENDETAVQKSNFFTVFGRISALLQAAGKLEKDVAAEQHDPEIAKALLTMPATLEALSKISAKWTAVESDLKAFLQ
jgi:hypothetical protein